MPKKQQPQEAEPEKETDVFSLSYEDLISESIENPNEDEDNPNQK
ncbi:MAG: hypothetical protein QW134_05755 [Nitrososphaeria archaeon]